MDGADFDRHQMRKMIANALAHPERLSSRRKLLIDDMFGDMLDGNSAQRVSNVLLSIASKC